MKEQKTVLQNELEKTKSEIDALESALNTQPDSSLGQGDPHVTRWEVDRALLKRLKERRDTLERAISGVNKGTYGLCKECGNPIHPDRLAVLPDTRTCIACAQTD